MRKAFFRAIFGVALLTALIFAGVFLFTTVSQQSKINSIQKELLSQIIPSAEYYEDSIEAVLQIGASTQLYTILTTLAITLTSALVITIFLSLLLSKQIIKPLKNLTEALNKYSQNITKPLSLKPLKLSGPDEINTLVAAYNTLIKELKKYHKAKQKFVEDINHDLKTSLTYTRLLIEQASFSKASAQKQALEAALHQIDKTVELFDRLKTIALAGAVSLKPKKIKLAKFIKEKIKPYRALAQAPIKTDIPQTAIIKADPFFFSQLFDNLIKNAIEHTKEGQISVVYKQGKLIVADTGEGIDPKLIKEIFKRGVTTKKGHVGLGLAIVKSICDLHGWKLKISSAPQKGTKVKILISDENTA